MKKSNYLSTSPMIVGMISAVWIISVLLLAEIDGPQFFIWSGFIFAVIDFVLTIVGTYFFAEKIKNVVEEISIVPCWYMGIFFFVALSMNSFFAFIYNGEPKKIVIILNLILYVVYASILLYINSYLKHMTEVNERIAAKTSVNDEYKMTVSILMGMAKTLEVKGSIQKLKDLIDYSDNVSVKWAENNERQFQEKLSEIQVMLSQNEADEVVISQVQDAIEIWKRRNIVVTNR